MGRHKETYAAKWESDRQVTITEQERVRIPLKIQSGDPGRPVALGLTIQELESLTKAAHEALHRHRVEQLRREFSKRELDFWQRQWDLTRQLAERARDIQQLDQRNKELEEVIERVHEVVHPDRSEAVDFTDRPNVVHAGSNVAH